MKCSWTMRWWRTGTGWERWDRGGRWLSRCSPMSARRALEVAGRYLERLRARSVEALIKHHAPVVEPALRQRLAQAYIEDRILEITGQRSAARRKSGLGAGPEGSVLKLMYSEQALRLQELACDLEGPGGQAWLPEDRWRRNSAWSFLRVRSKTIAGGTSEIQRNVLAERSLGLPREPDTDHDHPWNKTLYST